MADEAIVARNRRNKRAGADWEIALEEGFRQAGFDIQAVRKGGTNDRGDLVIKEADGIHLVIEAKTGAFQPGPFLTEAEVERKNYAKHRSLDPEDVDSIVIVKRRGKNWKQAFVLTTVADYFGLED